MGHISTISASGELELHGVILLLTHVGIPRSQSIYRSLRGKAPRPRKRRWPRVLLFTVFWLIAILVVLGGFGILWLRSAAKAALPVLDGDIHLAPQGAPAISAPVTVRRDAHGVPHIDAATQQDMFVAQGYVTAQDRLWQMDVLSPQRQRRIGRSHGPVSAPHDKAQRMFQFRNTAHRI